MLKQQITYMRMRICTDLCEGHSVGMFSDLSQPETLLHLSIPSDKKEKMSFAYNIHINTVHYIFRVYGGILNLAMQIISTC